MTSEKSPFEQLKARSDDEIISDNVSLITTYFSDVFDKYSFSLREKTIDEIVYGNRDFDIVFGYERNRYGIVEFHGVMIGVRSSGKRYALNYIVDVLCNNSEKSFDQKYCALTNMTGVEKCRVIWAEYVGQTFEDEAPKWEKEIPILLKKRFPDFF
jgi:hypothetical protein